MQMTTPARLRYRRVPAPPGMSGLGSFWSGLATTGSSLFNTGVTLYQTQQATEAAETQAMVDIETARAALKLAQSETEQARIAAEIARMEAENRRLLVQDIGKVAVPVVLGGAGLIWALRKFGKKKGRR